MAFWKATGQEKDVTETDSIIRRYTETVMHMLQEAHQEPQQDVLTGTDQLAVKGKYTSGGEAYWEAQYADPTSMQQHGFCKTASQKYGSHGSQIRVKPAGDSFVPEAVPLGYDAPFSTPALEIDEDAAPVNLGSRYLDEEEAVEKGERIPVLDNRASVEKTVIDDIERRKTIRKLSTLAALLERQKTGVPMQETLRLPRVAMVTLKARRRGNIRRDQPPVLCNPPEDCIRC